MNDDLRSIAMDIMDEDYLEHHGVKGQKWGDQNGPPYPLHRDQLSSEEKKNYPKGSNEAQKEELKKSSKTSSSKTTIGDRLNELQGTQEVTSDYKHKRKLTSELSSFLKIAKKDYRTQEQKIADAKAKEAEAAAKKKQERMASMTSSELVKELQTNRDNYTDDEVKSMMSRIAARNSELDTAKSLYSNDHSDAAEASKKSDAERINDDQFAKTKASGILDLTADELYKRRNEFSDEDLNAAISRLKLTNALREVQIQQAKDENDAWKEKMNAANRPGEILQTGINYANKAIGIYNVIATLSGEPTLDQRQQAAKDAFAAKLKAKAQIELNNENAKAEDKRHEDAGHNKLAKELADALDAGDTDKANKLTDEIRRKTNDVDTAYIFTEAKAQHEQHKGIANESRESKINEEAATIGEWFFKANTSGDNQTKSDAYIAVRNIQTKYDTDETSKIMELGRKYANDLAASKGMQPIFKEQKKGKNKGDSDSDSDSSIVQPTESVRTSAPKTATAKAASKDTETEYVVNNVSNSDKSSDAGKKPGLFERLMESSAANYAGSSGGSYASTPKTNDKSSKKSNKKTISDKSSGTIKSLISSGYTEAEAAEKLGVSISSVASIVSDAGGVYALRDIAEDILMD